MHVLVCVPSKTKPEIRFMCLQKVYLGGGGRDRKTETGERPMQKFVMSLVFWAQRSGHCCGQPRIYCWDPLRGPKNTFNFTIEYFTDDPIPVG